MTDYRLLGIAKKLKAKAWVIWSDVAGLAVLSALAGSSAIGDGLFVLLSCVLVAASFLLLAPAIQKPDSTATPYTKPLSNPRIVIVPKPAEWQSYGEG